MSRQKSDFNKIVNRGRFSALVATWVASETEFVRYSFSLVADVRGHDGDPPVLHFDDTRSQLSAPDDDWRMGVPDSDRVELTHIGSGGYRHTLFFDRIIKFQDADLHYRDAPKQGMLVLNVQVVVIGDGLVQEQVLRY